MSLFLFIPTLLRPVDSLLSADILSPVDLTDDPGQERFPSLSHDGEQIAYYWSSGPEGAGIYRLHHEGGIPELFVLNGIYPAWSPAGDRIAYLKLADNGFEVWIKSVTGIAVEEQLTTCLPNNPSSASYSGLCWSPDDRYLAYVDIPAPGEPRSIFLIEIESRERTQLTTPPSGIQGDFQPEFSPDGRAIGFIRESRNYMTRHVYVQRLSRDDPPQPRGEPIQVTPEEATIWSLDWSRNGRRILFVIGLAAFESYQVYCKPIRGGDLRPLSLGEEVRDITVARTGDRIVYSLSVGRSQDLWEVNGPNSGLQVAPAPFTTFTTDELEPEFSPDGKEIAFQWDTTGKTAIWVCDADDPAPSGQRLISPREWYLCMTPKWSPDGSMIAFSGAEDLKTIAICVRDREATGPVRRITPPDEILKGIVAWSRDGRSLYYFIGPPGSNRRIWKIPVAGGDPVQITHSASHTGFESTDGTSFYFYRLAPDNRIWKVPVNGGEETLLLDKQIPGEKQWTLWSRNGSDTIVYITHRPEEGPLIEMYDIESEKISIVARLGPDYQRSYGITVSPDGTRILFANLTSGFDLRKAEPRQER